MGWKWSHDLKLSVIMHKFRLKIFLYEIESSSWSEKSTRLMGRHEWEQTVVSVLFCMGSNFFWQIVSFNFQTKMKKSSVSRRRKIWVRDPILWDTGFLRIHLFPPLFFTNVFLIQFFPIRNCGSNKLAHSSKVEFFYSIQIVLQCCSTVIECKPGDQEVKSLKSAWRWAFYHSI